ncbi:MAG: serine/threonine protein kinase [Anaerolineales bacterium]|nr:serine/threonine protein kinase [Anaerolineales bacterium]
MAYVVLVSAADDEKLYALKLAKRDKDGFKQNFNALLLEANLLKKLDHPGIVKLAPLPQSEAERERKKPRRFTAYASEFPDQPPYFLMDFLAGGTLTDVLNQTSNEDISLPQALQFAHKLAETLAYLHDQGFLHNDLKPNNIMFTSAAKARALDEPILIDFGISTTKGAPYLDGLTVHYAAPEKLLHAIDSSYKPPASSGWVKVDVWGLGVILYQMLTRKYPYHGDDPDSLITTIRTRRPERISEFRGKVSKKVEELILEGCLSSDAKNRLTSLELRKQLEGML